MAFTSVQEVFDGMGNTFNADAASGVDAVFQFDITGEGGGKWVVDIKDGACRVQPGSADAATVTMTMDAPAWLKMVNKELNGMQAFMTGKLKIDGDIMLAQRFEQFFPM